jgi:hypothetical protein
MQGINHLLMQATNQPNDKVGIASLIKTIQILQLC